MLDTETLAGVSSGARTVAIVAVVLAGLLSGWTMAERGSGLPALSSCRGGLRLGVLIGDAWGARRVRRQYDGEH